MSGTTLLKLLNSSKRDWRSPIRKMACCLSFLLWLALLQTSLAVNVPGPNGTVVTQILSATSSNPEVKVVEDRDLGKILVYPPQPKEFTVKIIARIMYPDDQYLEKISTVMVGATGVTIESDEIRNSLILATLKVAPGASGGRFSITYENEDNPNHKGCNVRLLPIDIVAHKRGTIDAPGEEQPKGNGEYGYETVMMENADSEDNNTGKRDCDTAAVDKVKDDDFVKIVLHYPGPQIEGASLELKHEGIAVDAKVKGSEMEDPEAAIEVLDTGSRLNFYDKDGNKLNPATDLKIADLKNPGSGYLAKIFDPANNGKLTLFIEGADKFGLVGYKDADLEKLGGSRLKWIFEKGDQKAEIPVLVYRGGFLVFKQPKGKPGTAANFELWDGKGRIRHEFGGFGNEFKKDDTDFGKKIATWVAKSGKPVKPGKPRPYNKRNQSGHLPPGWYWEQSATVAQSEKDRWKNGVLHQGSYVRWKEDNTGVYKNDFEYDPARDSQAGKPTAMSFKYQLDPIKNWVKDPSRNNYKSYLDRTRCQVHPDGKKDGSGGCISIQTWDDCRDVLYVLKNYNALEVKVQLEE